MTNMYQCKNCGSPVTITDNWAGGARLTLSQWRVECAGDCPARDVDHVDQPVANGIVPV